MENNKMNALIFEEAGHAEVVLTYKCIDKPILAENQVMVKVLACPINPSDLFFINGTYRFKPNFPQIAGLEATGIIDQVPENSSLKVGMHVSFFSRDAWAEYAAVEPNKLLVLPADFPLEKAAQFALNPITAWGLAEAADLSEGDWLAVTAGNSTVARLIMQIAKQKKINVITLIRNPTQVNEVSRYTSHVIETLTGDIANKINQITNGNGINALIDPVGGDISTQIVKTLKTNGKVIIYGKLSNQPVQYDNGDFVYKNISVQGFGVLAYYQRKTIEEIQKITPELISILSDPSFNPDIKGFYEFRQFEEALLENKKKNSGKVIFVPENTQS